MDCLAFRHRVGADPDCRDVEITAHRLECRSCASWTREQQAFNDDLRAALDIPVPPELAARVIWRQTARRRAPGRFALAAVFLLLVAAGVLTAMLLPPAMLPVGPLPADVIAHIEHEPELLHPAASAAGPVQVSHVLERGSARFNGYEGRVTHAGLCPFRGHMVPHLVVLVDGEPVSVLLLADEHVAYETPIHRDGYDGVVLPQGRGSIAVVAPRPDLVEPAAEQLRRAVEWITT